MNLGAYEKLSRDDKINLQRKCSRLSMHSSMEGLTLSVNIAMHKPLLMSDFQAAYVVDLGIDGFELPLGNPSKQSGRHEHH